MKNRVELASYYFVEFGSMTETEEKILTGKYSNHDWLAGLKP